MEPIAIAILAIIGLFLMISIHIPIGVAMALSGFIAFGFMSGFAPAVSLFGTEASSALAHRELAVPKHCHGVEKTTGIRAPV